MEPNENMPFATELLAEVKEHAKRWYKLSVLLIILLVASNMAWLCVFQSYEYVSQDGSGSNIVGDSNEVGIYGTESED